MEDEPLKSELLQLFKDQSTALEKDQSTALENEVFGGMSLSERKEYDIRTRRINELEIEIAASELANKTSQSAKAEQKRQWSKDSETDTPQAEARQPYRSRERDSGDSQKSSKGANKTNVKRDITNEE
jgi:hypothetical protein